MPLSRKISIPATIRIAKIITPMITFGRMESPFFVSSMDGTVSPSPLIGGIMVSEGAVILEEDWEEPDPIEPETAATAEDWEDEDWLEPVPPWELTTCWDVVVVPVLPPEVMLLCPVPCQLLCTLFCCVLPPEG